MSRKAEVKISHGQESMTKSGKVFTIFQLLQDVDGYTGVNGEVISFQPYEIFRVRRGQRGAMSVELALGEDRFLPLGISGDGQGLTVVDPIIGQTILMNWTRTSNEEQDKGLNDPAANTDSGTANPLDLGDGPVQTHWVDGLLSADIVFESPEDLRRFGDWGREGEMSKKILACVAHNIEDLREPNAFELVFRVLLNKEVDPHIVVVGDEVAVFRLDVDVKDMFAVAKFTQAQFEASAWNIDYVKISMSNVIRSASEQAIAHHLDFKGVEVDYKPHSKLEEQEIIEILSGDQLDGLIETILMAETSGLARKWTSSYVIRVITQPGSHAGDVIVERLRQSEEPEGRGDIYRIDIKGQVNLERHRVRFQEYEGPMFSLENIRYKSDAVFDRVAFRGGPELKKPAKPAPAPSRDNRFDEPTRQASNKIPTREWIPQINQCVFIEDDPKQEMYYIADYDQADHKFLLLPADSLRRERLARQAPSYGSKDQSLHNLNGQIPVEPGRLRPFVLFH